MIGNVIEPKVMGEGLDLHPITVLLGLIFWGLVWGIVGMLLATPITAVPPDRTGPNRRHTPGGRAARGPIADGSMTRGADRPPAHNQRGESWPRQESS